MTGALSPPLQAVVQAAQDGISTGLGRHFGVDSGPVRWLQERFGRSLADVFGDPESYPLVQMPWWAGGGREPVPGFFAELTRSSMTGYLFIRLIDDVADGDHEGSIEVLPALSYFHREFERPYHHWFPSGHSFWQTFDSIWFGAARASIIDLRLTRVTREDFEAVSARKTSGALIPVAAVLTLLDRADELGAWESFITAFGRWHQFQNDLLGARDDLAGGNATFVLTEASRRSEAVPVGWLWTDGLDWSEAELDAFARPVQRLAAELNCPPVTRYVEARVQAWRERFGRVRTGLSAVDQAPGIGD